MLAFPSLYLTLALNRHCGVDLTTVSPAPPLFPKVFKIPRSARSIAHATVAEARWLRGHYAPRSGQCGLWRRLWRLLGCGCLEDGVANTHGDDAIALRGVILAHPVPQVRSPRALTDRRLLCLKHRCSQPGFGVVLIVDLPPCIRGAGGPSPTPCSRQLQRPVETSAWESTVLVRTSAVW